MKIIEITKTQPPYFSIEVPSGGYNGRYPSIEIATMALKEMTPEPRIEKKRFVATSFHEEYQKKWGKNHKKKHHGRFKKSDFLTARERELAICGAP